MMNKYKIVLIFIFQFFIILGLSIPLVSLDKLKFNSYFLCFFNTNLVNLQTVIFTISASIYPIILMNIKDITVRLAINENVYFEKTKNSLKHSCLEQLFMIVISLFSLALVNNDITVIYFDYFDLSYSLVFSSFIFSIWIIYDLINAFFDLSNY